MSDGFFLLCNRGVLLSVSRRHDTFTVWHVGDAAYLEKLPRHIQIERLAGDTIQLDQRQFQFLMAGSLADRFAVVVPRIANEEDVVDMLGTFLGDIEQLFLSSRLVLGDRRLIQMPDVI